MINVYIMYLRKSRQDDPSETVEEVLAKHETMLQEYAMRELGGPIPEKNIYREVVSGESIDDRVEIKKVLARIEDPSVKGVLVIEPSRLSRGDLEDCGRLINDLRYTHTEVVTPIMSYDLSNKMERKFFQDELLRGRDYLEYTKEILFRGRVAAVKRGCFISNIPPYGYNKVKIGKDHTLEPNENADVVRSMYDWYIKEQLTPARIAKRLNEMCIPGPTGGEWLKDTVRGILRNAHYVGKVVYNRTKYTIVLEDGERKSKRKVQPDEEVIIAEGKQPAIIDEETWNAAQELAARNPKVTHTRTLKNPLGSIFKCSKCGKAMSVHQYKSTEDRFECRTSPRCFRSVKVSEVLEALAMALENAELPELKAKVDRNDGDARKIQEKRLEQLEKQMKEYKEQEENQYDLLETKVYTQELFDRRNAALREKMEECQKQIFQTKSSLPQSVDYAERVVALETAIAALKDKTATPKEINRVLRAIIERIEYKGIPSSGANQKGVKRNDNTFTLDVFLRL